jgi:hypothetical protein
MKWYFAVNEASLVNYKDLITVAVCTAREKTALAPNLIFDGTECEFTANLQKNGVRIHFRASSFGFDLDKRPEVDGYKSSIARGAYLRLEIPEIELEDEYVLYTDVDVMFKSDYSWNTLRPRLFMASGEYDTSSERFEQSDSVFNSGVMIINVIEFKRRMPGFLQSIREHQYYYHGKGGFYDQGALNDYFHGEYEALPNSLNWRIFAKDESPPVIVHFHGPKPVDIQRCINNDPNVYDVLKNLYRANPVTYKEELRFYMAALARSNS